MKPKCFVIRPLHTRSDRVVRLYISDACKDLVEVIPAGQEIGNATITDHIFQHLRDDAIVIAYLDRPSRVEGDGNSWLWNANVMLETGFRMALGPDKPIVFLRERQLEGEPLLPFDIHAKYVIQLPTMQEENGGEAHLDSTVAKIRRFVKAGLDEIDRIEQQKRAAEQAAEQENQCVYPCPSITIECEPGAGVVREASCDAARFFGINGNQSLVGMPLQTLVDKILRRLPPPQRTAFGQEQNALIGQIYNGQIPTATVCLVFRKPDPRGGEKCYAYLPLVARSILRRRGAGMTLHVNYLNVTPYAKKGNDGVMRCPLGPSRATIQ